MTTLSKITSSSASPKKTQHLSATSIGVYRDCPACFLRRKQGHEESKPYYFLTGSAMHEAAELGLKQKKLGNPVATEDVVAWYWDYIKANETDIDWGRVERSKALTDTLSATISLWEALRSVHVLEVEVPFSIPIADDWTLDGRIDLVTPGMVWDFKGASPSARWTYQKALKERQPGIYAAAYEQQTGGLPRFGFFESTKGHEPSVSLFEVPITRARVAGALLSARLIVDAIETGNFPSREGCSKCKKH